MIRKNFFQTMTAQEFREFMRNPKQEPKENKYHAHKTEVDGITFDSKKESRHYQQLKSMEDSGIISNLQRQVKFVLLDGYVNNKGEKIRPILYFADFTYTKDGKKYVADTKSLATKTPVYKLKKKLFEAKFTDYIFVEM